MILSSELLSLATVAWNTLAIYLFLVLGFRFMGRRQLGQLTVIDLVIVIIMGSAVETAMVNGDVSLPAGLVSATTLFLVNRLFARICLRSRRWRHIVTGGPVVLVHYGQVVEEHLRRVGMTTEDMLEAIRLRGYTRLDDVKFAILEEDGEINVVTSSAKSIRTGKAALVGRTAKAKPAV
jgi:uncharacterized membrane protein YcaP (DUF421 family)